jgi:hypothetical protein
MIMQHVQVRFTPGNKVGLKYGNELAQHIMRAKNKKKTISLSQ